MIQLGIKVVVVAVDLVAVAIHAVLITRRAMDILEGVRDIRHRTSGLSTRREELIGAVALYSSVYFFYWFLSLD